MHRIENEFLRITAREYGAELTSVFCKRTNTEHLWQADEKLWGWHAPVLFPVVGRCLNDEIILDGKSYTMEKHGFARKSVFQLLELGNTKMVFSLLHNDDTLRIYPFKFEFLIAYYLHDNQFKVSYEVINRDTKPMWFQLGGHPAFAVPFNAQESYNDYYLEFTEKENSPRHYIDSDGFFDGRKETVLNNSNSIALRNDLFNQDALIFKDLKSRTVSIKCKHHVNSLTVNFEGFPYLGLWAKENAPYVCIEPWLGCADTAGKAVEMKKREGVMMLEPGEAINPHFTVSIQ